MKKKGTFTNFLLILVLLAGLSLLLYPSFADWWNSRVQSKAIASYTAQISVMDEDTYRDYWDSAIAYNKSLLNRTNTFVLTEEQTALYDSQLNFSADGIMGYIEIPMIEVYLPVYHGTSEQVLQVAVGHLEWTSLPTGGESTHCVLSGHRGLPSAKLFTDLDQMQLGDLFMLHVLDETLTYEVDQILIVEPDDTDALLVEEGKDLCTLVTCTPYGVNTHRLLVRGHRVDNLKETVVHRVTADAIQIEPLIVAPIVAIPLLIIMLFLMPVLDRGKDD